MEDTVVSASSNTRPSMDESSGKISKGYVDNLKSQLKTASSTAPDILPMNVRSWVNL